MQAGSRGGCLTSKGGAGTPLRTMPGTPGTQHGGKVGLSPRTPGTPGTPESPGTPRTSRILGTPWDPQNLLEPLRTPRISLGSPWAASGFYSTMNIIVKHFAIRISFFC